MAGLAAIVVVGAYMGKMGIYHDEHFLFPLCFLLNSFVFPLCLNVCNIWNFVKAHMNTYQQCFFITKMQRSLAGEWWERDLLKE